MAVYDMVSTLPRSKTSSATIRLNTMIIIGTQRINGAAMDEE